MPQLTSPNDAPSVAHVPQTSGYVPESTLKRPASSPNASANAKRTKLDYATLIADLEAEVAELRDQQAQFQQALTSRNRLPDAASLIVTVASDETDAPGREPELQYNTESDLYGATPPPRDKPQTNSSQQPATSHQKGTFQQDPTASTMVLSTVMLYRGMRMPIFVQDLARGQKFDLPSQPNEQFDLTTLQTLLGGEAASEGFYTISEACTSRSFAGLRAYKALDTSYDPLLPRYPGEHGAQISCIPRDEPALAKDYYPFALFIRKQGGGYRYFGNYDEPCQDLLGTDEMLRLPQDLKWNWAHKLGTRSREEYKYMNALEELFFVPTTATRDGYKTDISDNEDKRNITAGAAINLTAKAIAGTFGRHDSDPLPTMYMFYEYLQFVDYDSKFYALLVAEKKMLEGDTAISAVGSMSGR
ncbi:uncharacterized protein BP5553_08076 [Venustampulla echinocandica]|uniref:DUF6697 domain-containing protein n=1 Tax=Venustampulla echinocandica TaxID=2656787 RepID=A0A370TFM9_9HELO|nr:uncharacterized protein BP5553_08076 [Venustampulla echinocandica]RDL33708.1 hypothetical protein BP5553_08076 [Venustampulla echinocandica]